MLELCIDLQARVLQSRCVRGESIERRALQKRRLDERIAVAKSVVSVGDWSEIVASGSGLIE